MDWSWDGVKELVANVAPGLGAAIGGLPGAAFGSLVADALGVEKSPEAVEQALKSNPEAVLKLKQLEADVERERIRTRGAVIQAEAKGESWLQRNWRPLTMLWFSVLVGGYWFGLTPPNLSEESVLSMFGLIKLGLGGYVIGRSAEKITQTVAGTGLVQRAVDRVRGQANG